MFPKIVFNVLGNNIEKLQNLKVTLVVTVLGTIHQRQSAVSLLCSR